jgi:lipoyl(octanoyl) transferase
MTVSARTIALKRAGLVDYEIALELQRQFHEEIANGFRPDTVIFIEHPPVYTAGRRTDISDRPLDGTKVIEVDRGGKITFHGPGQLVGYPIIKLANPMDVVGFVRELEGALIAVCAEFDIPGERFPGRSGVWVRDSKGDRKIAAIGIRVARGVTMHGFALNVSTDLSYFDRIVPCGIPDAGVTSLSAELGRFLELSEVEPVVEKHLFDALVRVTNGRS